MTKIIKAAMKLNEETILDLLDEAVKAIQKECDARNLDEYVDDYKWGKDRFEVPIFIFNGSLNPEPVDIFRFIYDPEDEDYSIEEQMHVQLDEFIQDWTKEESEEYSGEELVDDLIDEVVFECLEKYRKTKTIEAITKMVKAKLAKAPYNLTEGEDFTDDDIAEVMNDYKYYWD